MYYRIEKSGCCEHKGLCQVRADFYYDETDKGYALTECKIFPKEGYPGKVNDRGMPVDIDDYKKWRDSLPVEMKLNPFVSRFIYFDHKVTEEEILFCYEIAKSWYESGATTRNVKPVWKPENKSVSATKIVSLLTIDFTAVKNAELYSVRA
jgi:hypothetical protein